MDECWGWNVFDTMDLYMEFEVFFVVEKWTEKLVSNRKIAKNLFAVYCSLFIFIEVHDSYLLASKMIKCFRFARSADANMGIKVYLHVLFDEITNFRLPISCCFDEMNSLQVKLSWNIRPIINVYLSVEFWRSVHQNLKWKDKISVLNENTLQRALKLSLMSKYFINVIDVISLLILWKILYHYLSSLNANIHSKDEKSNRDWDKWRNGKMETHTN